jgi:hypothetical protein
MQDNPQARHPGAIAAQKEMRSSLLLEMDAGMVKLS